MVSGMPRPMLKGGLGDIAAEGDSQLAGLDVLHGNGAALGTGHRLLRDKEDVSLLHPVPGVLKHHVLHAVRLSDQVGLDGDTLIVHTVHGTDQLLARVGTVYGLFAHWYRLLSTRGRPAVSLSLRIVSSRPVFHPERGGFWGSPPKQPLLYHPGRPVSRRTGNFLRSNLLKILQFLRQGPPAVLHRAPLRQREALHGAKGPGLQPWIAAVQLIDQLLDLLSLGVPVGGTWVFHHRQVKTASPCGGSGFPRSRAEGGSG